MTRDLGPADRFQDPAQTPFSFFSLDAGVGGRGWALFLFATQAW